MLHRLGSLLGVVMLVGSAQGEEVPVPKFDVGKVKASYVVSLPSGYDKSKAWPLIVDFHGAISPERKGANVTRERLWSKFVKREGFIVVGLNGRTRGWGRVRGEKDDKAYARHVLGEVLERYNVDRKRVYLAGFSSGSDFLCSSGLQREAKFGGSMVVCPGPANVVGLRDGSLIRAKGQPFYFATGEEDYIRKNGAWRAFLELDALGSPVMYREVPGVGHSFFDVAEYGRLFRYLEVLAGNRKAEALALAKGALERGDYLLASTLLRRMKETPETKKLLETIRERGQLLLKVADAIDPQREAGRAFHTWWQLRTQFHRFEPLAKRGQQELDGLRKKFSNRDLLKAQGEFYRLRKSEPKGADEPGAKNQLWSFDRYLDYDALTKHVRDLARRYPKRVELIELGKSVEGRTLWGLAITDESTGPAGDKPAVYLQGAIHGNEVSSLMTVLYIAHRFAVNPQGSRVIDKLMRTTTLYVVPAVNPDAVHHYFAEPHSPWRPRYNYRRVDTDRDGKIDEDPTEDLDKDGEIGLMYQPDPKGPFVLKGGRMVRGKGSPTYKLVAREGIDNDKDGLYSEDPAGGVDLNRNFGVGFRSRRQFGGTSGPKAASEPETRAVVEFVTKHENIGLFLDYHNDADCLFYWTPADNKADLGLYQALAERAKATLGYTPRPLHHTGAGLAVAWAYGARGIPAFIVELERSRGEQSVYLQTAWKGQAFIPVRKFDHPQLGPILLGNDYKKLAKRNPHPKDIVWQGERNLTWVKELCDQLPRLEVRDRSILLSGGKYTVTGTIHNVGTLPTDLAMAETLKRSQPIALEANGVRLVGKTRFATLEGGRSHRFRVEFVAPKGDGEVVLTVRHPRAGAVRFPVVRRRSPTRAIRKKYKIEEGYSTPDRATPAENEFFRKGVPLVERGPAFELTHRKPVLRLGVILAEWKDQRHTLDAEVFEKALFSKNEYTGRSATGQPVYGSLRDFFDEMSFGKQRVTGKVFDWVELPGKYEDYRSASFGSSKLRDAMIAAIRKREGEGALVRFDGLAFIWAGNRVERTSALWPMRLKFPDLPEVIAFKMAELDEGEMTIGVACHEMGHTFGVADKYGLGATENPLGPWCLMGKGTHGGSPSGRHRPFHMCAWCKMVIGWLKPVAIDPSKPQKLALRPILFGPGEAYRVLLKPDGSEYLLLENRRREGFFSDLPSPGLVVLRVGPNDSPAYPQKRVQLLAAHGLPPLRRGVLADPARVAWPQRGKTELEVRGVRLSKIRLKDDVVYFEVGPVGE